MGKEVSTYRILWTVYLIVLANPEHMGLTYILADTDYPPIAMIRAHMLTSVNHDQWWRHPMEALSALLVFCAGNSSVTTEFPAQRPVTRSFDIFFDLRLSKRLNKQSKRRWFETPSRSLWRHCNAIKDHWSQRCTDLLVSNVTVVTYHLGAVSIRKTVLPGMAIPMLKIRRPNGRLIFNMEIAIRR